MTQLTYLDLSNNQLTGHFPEWVHGLTKLQLLNLGQNHISGEIPIVIGRRLMNLRTFFNSPAGRHEKYSTIRPSFKEFFRAYYPWMKRSKDLFWVDSIASWHENFSGILDAYYKAEANQITSKLFENIRRDPVRIVELLGYSPKLIT